MPPPAVTVAEPKVEQLADVVVIAMVGEISVTGTFTVSEVQL